MCLTLIFGRRHDADVTRVTVTSQRVRTSKLRYIAVFQRFSTEKA